LAAARDLLKVLLHSKDPESGTALINEIEPDEIIQTALEDLMDYRIFRYAGKEVPASLEDAFAVSSSDPSSRRRTFGSRGASSTWQM
jgi:hypothetical protein